MGLFASGEAGTSAAAYTATAAAAGPSTSTTGGGLPPEPKRAPINARDIIHAINDQYWQSPHFYWAFDGKFNLVTPDAQGNLPETGQARRTFEVTVGGGTGGRRLTWKVRNVCDKYGVFTVWCVHCMMLCCLHQLQLGTQLPVSAYSFGVSTQSTLKLDLTATKCIVALSSWKLPS